MSQDQIDLLTTSNVALREYEANQDAQYPRLNKVENTNRQRPRNRNKRRASSQLFKAHPKSLKSEKLLDSIFVNLKDALDQSMLFPSSIDHADADAESEQKPSIELVLKRLYSLYKLIGSASKPTEKTDTYDEEYKVEKILKMQMGNKEPMYEVKWVGYNELTWEPVANIYDCKAFEKFSNEFINTHTAQLKQIWYKATQQLSNEHGVDTIDPHNVDTLATVNRFDYYQLQSFLFQLCVFEETDVNQKTKTYQTVCEQFNEIIKYHGHYIMRLKQLLAMNKWLESINSIDQSKNLRVENLVDLELPPFDEFTYTNDVVPRDGIVIPNDPPVGCECTENSGQCSAKSNCCANAFESKFAYTTKGAVRVPRGTPIFECNKRCTCSDSCTNRVVQKGRKQTLTIFKTLNGRGWGVRTDRAISKGQYVCEYVGEIISSEETERRGKEYDARGRTYLFDLDFNEKDNPYTIDAAKYGNVSRFLNHSCEPNVGVWAVWTDCLDLNLPKLCMFTLRSIKEREELTFDYMNRMNGNQLSDDSEEENDPLRKQNHNTQKSSCEPCEDTPSTANENGTISETDTDAITVSSDENQQDEVELKTISKPTNESTSTYANTSKSFQCKCGADSCRKVLFF